MFEEEAPPGVDDAFYQPASYGRSIYGPGAGEPEGAGAEAYWGAGSEGGGPSSRGGGAPLEVRSFPRPLRDAPGVRK